MFQTKRKPETLIGFGEKALAYLIPSKKSTASRLDEQTLELLAELDAPVETIEDQPERIVLNPELTSDPALLEIVGEALQADPRLEGVQIFLKQESRSKQVVSEETIFAAAKNARSEEEAIDLVGRIMNISVGRFKLDGETDSAKVIKSALAIVSEIGILGQPEPKKAKVKK
jgi:GTPase involved in cell partitioning and DNA repair